MNNFPRKRNRDVYVPHNQHMYTGYRRRRRFYLQKTEYTRRRRHRARRAAAAPAAPLEVSERGAIFRVTIVTFPRPVLGVR